MCSPTAAVSLTHSKLATLHNWTQLTKNSLPECVILVKDFCNVQKSHFESFRWVRETIITNECFWYFYFFWDKMFTKRLLMSSNTCINLKIIRFRSIYRRGKFYFAHLEVSWLKHGFEQEKLFDPLYLYILIYLGEINVRVRRYAMLHKKHIIYGTKL